MKDQGTVIIDVRPSEFYQGKKSDEARAGHIPGALNRPFSEDLDKVDNVTLFKPADELAAAYAALIPSRRPEWLCIAGRDTRPVRHFSS